MPSKAVNSYLSVIQFVSDLHKTQEMCVKTFDTCSFEFNYVSDQH